MILKIKDKGLKDYWERETAKRLHADWLPRIKRILIALDQAKAPADMDLPGWRLHMLKGDRKGLHAVNVSGNWRIVFRFEGTDVTDIDLVDYH